MLLLATVALAPAGPAFSQSSQEAKRADPVGVGEVAPDFTLADQDGGERTLSAQRGKQPVVLIFYRGYW